MANTYLVNSVLLNRKPRAILLQPGSIVSEDLKEEVIAAGGILAVGTSEVVKAAALATKIKPEYVASVYMLSAASGSDLDYLKEDYLIRDEWFIDSEVGSDSNSGLEGHPIKTWAEWQRRVGTGILNPAGGTLKIYLQPVSTEVDFPEDDPITCYNKLAPGKFYYIIGQKKVLTSGTASAIQTKDRAANEPYTLTFSGASSADFWEEYVNKSVWITSGVGEGSRAYVDADLGSKTAKMTEWFTGPVDGLSFVGFMFPGDAPEATSEFNVVEYTSVNLSDGDSVPFNFTNDDAPSEFVFTQLNIRNVKFTPQIPSSYSDCTFEKEFKFFSSNVDTLSNCNFLEGFSAYIGSTPTILGGKMSSCLLQACKATMDGDVCISGGEEGEFPIQIHYGATLDTGPLNFWNGANVVILNTGFIRFTSFSPVYGEPGYVPAWGDSESSWFMGPGSQLHIEQFQLDSEPLVPSLPADPAVLFSGSVPLDGDDLVFAFLKDGPEFVPDGGLSFTWDKLEIDQPSGFRVYNVTDGGREAHFSNAQEPSLNCHITWNCDIITP